ncbi:MAG TPA: histidine--tRNA ligase [Hyphomicrobiaceae bacterium]|nr:histidine--tRNA ligase [Hyphomicrobiaceae bacterium]
MAKTNKEGRPAATSQASGRPKARLPKGLRDRGPAEIRAETEMLAKIRAIYERYGFEPLETPAIEYADALGKFLPDQDRPNEGVFSFQDDDLQWLSLRYDLTAPLARHVAENLDKLPKPFRRYAVGPVWRNEKPGPGRYRQFTQFDADTVGTDNIAADAEMCMLAADTLEALGVKRGDYVIKVNSRKILDGLLESVSIAPDDNVTKLRVLRAFDKLDRLGRDGVAQLLGEGREDESGDFTQGAKLTGLQISALIEFFDSEVESWEPLRQLVSPPIDEWVIERGPDGSPGPWVFDRGSMLLAWEDQLRESERGLEGVRELRELDRLCRGAGFGSRRIRIDPSVVRGLEYYTGPVFEAEITVPVVNEDGQTVRLGSVGGGGRYDDLVARFTGQKVPATGFSIGVSRLAAALAALGKAKGEAANGPVVVLVMEKDRLADYQRMAQTLRAAGIRAEMYLGTAGIKAQMKYADKRGAPCVVIQGSDERNAPGGPMVQIKDLIEGSRAAATIKDSKEWREGRPAQFSVPESELVSAVRRVLERHRS